MQQGSRPENPEKRANIGWIQHVFCTRKMDVRSTSRKVHSLLQLLALNKNPGWAADPAGAARRTALCGARAAALVCC